MCSRVEGPGEEARLAACAIMSLAMSSRDLRVRCMHSQCVHCWSGLVLYPPAPRCFLRLWFEHCWCSGSIPADAMHPAACEECWWLASSCCAPSHDIAQAANAAVSVLPAGDTLYRSLRCS